MIGLVLPGINPALIAAQLLVDLLGRLIERDVGILRHCAALENQALCDVGHDIAAEAAVWCLTKRDVRSQRA